MLDFTPDFVFVVNVVVEGDHHDAQAVLGCGRGFFAVDFLKREKISFEGPRHLGFYLFAGCSGIDGGYDSFTDCKRRKFILWHIVHPEYSEEEQDADNEDRYWIMLKRPAEPGRFLSHGPNRLRWFLR